MTLAGHLTAGDQIHFDGAWQTIRAVKHSTRVAAVMITLADGTRIPASIYRELETRSTR